MARFADLTTDEVADLFQCAHRIAPILQRVYNGTSLTLALQDGKDAGQTVEHVHVHLIPRRPGDFDNNDDIYDKVSSGVVNVELHDIVIHVIMCMFIIILYCYLWTAGET